MGDITDRIQQQYAAEDAAAARLLNLLGKAREDLRQRIEALPAGAVSREVLAQMLAAMEETTGRVRSDVTGLLEDESGRSLALGRRLAEATLPRVEAGVAFGFSDEFLTAISQYHASLVQSISDSLRGRIEETILRGMLSGRASEAMAADLVANGLQPLGLFKSAEDRAEAIVRTEINRVSNLGALARYEDAATRIPGLRKRWVATKDARTRDSHRKLDGVTVAMDEDFSVNGHPAVGPHDARLPASEVVRCRCRTVAQVPEE